MPSPRLAFRPIKVVDIEIGTTLPMLIGLDRYAFVRALIRLHGVPLGFVRVPVQDGRCSATSIHNAILDKLAWAAAAHAVEDHLTGGFKAGLHGAIDLLEVAHPQSKEQLPAVTVAICTRDRVDDLTRCLESIKQLDYPGLDVLVVDNAPRDDATEKLVHTRFPTFRYVVEPRPGLNQARNRAVAEAWGEVVAFTDDDVVVDPGWVMALGRAFAAGDQVMAVTGLGVPYEIETEAQLLFEIYGGFGKGFRKMWYRLDPKRIDEETMHFGAGRFGVGANMAYRRRLFDEIGNFDPALDVGTVTNGGGDHEMFFRVLEEGHTLVYEPAAIIRHCHRRDYDSLRKQITNNGIGFYSYLVRSALAYPRRRWAIARFGLWWLGRWSMRRLLISFFRPGRFPRELIIAELRGSLMGLTRYPQARRDAAAIARRVSAAPPPVGEGRRPAQR